jgi:phage terminase large subunit-like protein
MVGLVVAVDPPASQTEDAAECGILVVGRGEDGHGYLIDDWSIRGSPATWGDRAVSAFQDYQADQIVAEKNNGGEMVRFVLEAMAQKGDLPRDLGSTIQMVWASRGKRTRAEPVAALMEKGLLHVVGSLPTLEDQFCSWVPITGQASPDRLDAAVWGVTALMLDEMPTVRGVTVPGFGQGSWDPRTLVAASRGLVYGSRR